MRHNWSKIDKIINEWNDIKDISLPPGISFVVRNPNQKEPLRITINQIEDLADKFVSSFENKLNLLSTPSQILERKASEIFSDVVHTGRSQEQISEELSSISKQFEIKFMDIKERLTKVVKWKKIGNARIIKSLTYQEFDKIVRNYNNDKKYHFLSDFVSTSDKMDISNMQSSITRLKNETLTSLTSSPVYLIIPVEYINKVIEYKHVAEVSTIDSTGKIDPDSPQIIHFNWSQFVLDCRAKRYQLSNDEHILIAYSIAIAIFCKRLKESIRIEKIATIINDTDIETGNADPEPIKLKIKDDHLNNIMEILNLKFEEDDLKELKNRLKNTSTHDRKLLFNGQCASLCDFFYQLMHNNVLSITAPKENIVSWILNNFKYMNKGHATDLKKDTVRKIINNNTRVGARSKIIQVTSRNGIVIFLK
jgi:hypothetical protein